jgi:hypothetical protein
MFEQLRVNCPRKSKEGAYMSDIIGGVSGMRAADSVPSFGMGSVGSVVGGAASYLPEPKSNISVAVETAGDIISTVGQSVIGGVPSAISGNYAELLQLQIQYQMLMQTTSMISNVEKSRHETKMTPIRNIRVG